MFEEIFRDKIPNGDKLLSYGFSLEAGVYLYRTAIMDGAFALEVAVKGAEVGTRLIENDGGEYILYKTDAEGRFVGEVRKAVASALGSIADRCFDPSLYRQELTVGLISYIKDSFGGRPEYLWDKFPKYCVFRRADNGKWYAVIMNPSCGSLGLDGAGEKEIIDLRVPPEDMDGLLKSGLYLPGWHMNKKHWLTACLDGTVGFSELCRRVDVSYEIAGRR